MKGGDDVVTDEKDEVTSDVSTTVVSFVVISFVVVSSLEPSLTPSSEGIGKSTKRGLLSPLELDDGDVSLAAVVVGPSKILALISASAPLESILVLTAALAALVSFSSSSSSSSSSSGGKVGRTTLTLDEPPERAPPPPPPRPPERSKAPPTTLKSWPVTFCITLSIT